MYMDQKGNQFSTFAGVFTPSILTILGVIMFLRAGYVVGEAGIINTIIILCVAEVISLLTAISMSAIATNTPVAGGGAYFLISRALGPQFGGAIGPLDMATMVNVYSAPFAPLWGAAREACLKTLEMTGGRIATLAETYLGLRHGPMSFVEPETLVVCFIGQGCAAPRATANILAAAEEAVRVNIRADEELAAALSRHSQDQQAALDEVFLADFRRLAAQDGGTIGIEDLIQGKRLYDEKLSQILGSREAVQRLFLSKHRTHMAALDLIQKARTLAAGQVAVLNELEQSRQEIGRLLQVAFPQLAAPLPTTIPARAGEGRGNQP